MKGPLTWSHIQQDELIDHWRTGHIDSLLSVLVPASLCNWLIVQVCTSTVIHENSTDLQTTGTSFVLFFSSYNQVTKLHWRKDLNLFNLTVQVTVSLSYRGAAAPLGEHFLTSSFCQTLCDIWSGRGRRDAVELHSDFVLASYISILRVKRK